jgi:hypothetical protein
MSLTLKLIQNDEYRDFRRNYCARGTHTQTLYCVGKFRTENPNQREQAVSLIRSARRLSGKKGNQLQMECGLGKTKTMVATWFCLLQNLDDLPICDMGTNYEEKGALQDKNRCHSRGVQTLKAAILVCTTQLLLQTVDAVLEFVPNARIGVIQSDRDRLAEDE